MKISTCPMCGSTQLKTVFGKLTFKAPHGEVAIPKVKRQRCAVCGEEFFDHAANALLDRYREAQTSKSYPTSKKLASMAIRDDQPKQYQKK